MIPAPDMRLVPAGPFVLAENPFNHTLVLTTVRDWHDGRGPQPLLYQARAFWKQQRSGAGRGAGVAWLGYRPEDVAIAHLLLELLNARESALSAAALVGKPEGDRDG